MGLIPKLGRRPNGRRAVPDEVVRRITLIRTLRDSGFDLRHAGTIAEKVSTRSYTCEDLSSTLHAEADHLRARISALRKLESRLRGIADSCMSDCGGRQAGDCQNLAATM
jgi:DNA-binding transcriptional MerR regulator